MLEAASPNYDTERSMHGIDIKHDPELEYTEYVIGKAGTAILISNEVANQAPLSKLKGLFSQEQARVYSDPWGDSCVDPDLRDCYYDTALSRTINTLSDTVQDQLGQPMVIKTNQGPIDEFRGGPTNQRGHHENLLDQYHMMRHLKKLSLEKFTEAQREVIGFADVYGAVALNDGMHFLMMEHVPGDHMETLPVKVDRHFDKKVVKKEEYWLSKEDHRQLYDAFPLLEDYIVKEYDGTEIFNAADLREVIAQQLDIPTKALDTASRNILQAKNATRPYTIIDQNPFNPDRPRYTFISDLIAKTG